MSGVAEKLRHLAIIYPIIRIRYLFCSRERKEKKLHVVFLSSEIKFFFFFLFLSGKDVLLSAYFLRKIGFGFTSA